MNHDHQRVWSVPCLLGLLCLVGSVQATRLQAGQPELVDAIEAKSYDEALRLLSGDAASPEVDVNAGQPDGMTSLHWAVQHGQSELVHRLLARGARANSRNRYAVTPLCLACQNGDEAMVKALLAAGADPQASLPNGETVLMTAARTGQVGPARALIAAGADVHACEKGRQTALMWAAAAGNTDVVDVLIAAGADIDASLASGFNALFFAVREGHVPVVLKLIQSGCNVNSVMASQAGVRFGNGRLSTTPLILAIENGHFELGTKLLEAGADPNAHPSGYTALHTVTWVRKPIRGDGDLPPRGSGGIDSLEIVRVLARAGADLDARMENGQSQLGRFTYTGATPLLLAAQASDVALVRLLIELGADPHIATSDGTTPLLAACGVGALDDGHESAGTEDEVMATVGYLLTQDADINGVDYNGETVMHGAAYQSWPRLVGFLADHGAAIDVWHHENRAGWTPLLIAEGHRPGNFRPAPETIAAIKEAMRQAGASVPDTVVPKEHLRTWSTIRNEDRAWVVKDVTYAHVDGRPLLLDLHFPERVAGSTLIVWVHGGQWRSGSKADMPLARLVKAGYSVASVNYRLSTEAKFPAQIHDLKAAIRFLRKIASRYGYRSDALAIAGASAGGHLAALVGTTNGHPELEGSIGICADQSSDVQAIVDFFGPSDLMTILGQSTAHGRSIRTTALDLLLGAQPDTVPRLAKLASPIEHVDAKDPPLLVIHGDQDPQVPIEQSIELVDKYKSSKLPHHFEILPGGQHGGEQFFDEQRQNVIREFLERHLE